MFMSAVSPARFHFLPGGAHHRKSRIRLPIPSTPLAAPKMCVKHADWPPFLGRLWQRNYYERAIRNEQEWQRAG